MVYNRNSERNHNPDPVQDRIIMHATHTPPPWLRRGAAGLALVLLMAGLLAAQNPKKPLPSEDEDPKAKPKKQLPSEDEDPKAKVKPLPGENDPVKPNKTVTPTRPLGDGKIDLAEEAKKATNPDLKALYQEFRFPFDVLKHKTTGEVRVAPVEPYVGNSTNDKDVKYTPLLPDGTRDKLSATAIRHELVSAKHFEEIILERVNLFLENGRTLRRDDRNYISPLDQLAAADKLLTYAVKFNENALKGQGAKRSGPGWDGVHARLKDRLREVLSDELGRLDTESASDPSLKLRAADLAFRIGDEYSENIKALAVVEVWKLNQADNNLDKDDVFIRGAKGLKDLEKRFPNSDPRILDPFRDKLRRRSQAHFDKARQLAANDEGKFLALAQIDMAELIDPDLEGLKDFATQMKRSYRLIVVGVKSLPERMSPTLALTDADRFACELLYEGLVQPVPDPAVGQRYRTQLAALPPKLVPMGREFQLINDAVWATKDGPGEKITAYTIKKNVEMLLEARNTPAADGMDVLKLAAVTDPLRFVINLDRGCLEPLAAMSFKVLPAELLDKKPAKLFDPEFAANPVGSGPYTYHGRKTEDNREYAVFKANPAYGKRKGKFGLPRIQEIRFVVAPSDPATDLREGKIDLLLDVSSADLVRLRQSELGLARTVTEVTLPSRRIWMLAVNHRRPELGQEPGKPLRRALAHAVNRDDIVTKVFRAGTQAHRVLNGPFPPDTWATPKSPPPLFQDQKAQTFAKAARMPDKLTLKFADNLLIRQACTMIKQQIEGLNLGTKIELVPLSEAALHQAVMVDHDYDLAYVPFDYNETYSLGGLLDEAADGRGERNFLGYKPDANSGRHLQALRQTRDFREVRRWTQSLYTTFNDQMPFIPLWQLDFHLLASQNLEPMPQALYLDPLTVFDQAEEWRVKR
ncbi:MAG: ABC transporter substrate-binding protein [Gemmataceae bacterium]